MSKLARDSKRRARLAEATSSAPAGAGSHPSLSWKIHFDLISRSYRPCRSPEFLARMSA